MTIRWGKRALIVVGVCGLVGASLIAGTAGAGADGADDTTAKPSAKHQAAKKKAAKKKAAKQKHAAHDMAAMTPKGDKGLGLLSNGHHSEMTEEQPLTPAERAELSRQIESTIAVAKKYATVEDALAAGYKRTGPYMPGIGAHYIRLSGQGLNTDGVMDDADIEDPLAIVYAGTDPTSPIAGFMYYSMSKTQPAGFAGANDVWHYHESLCLKYGPDGIDVPYGLDRSATQKQCASVGGTLMKQTQWMLHVWSVPGWESRQGLFGEVNPGLMCPDGTYYQLPPSKWNLHPLNACKSAA